MDDIGVDVVVVWGVDFCFVLVVILGKLVGSCWFWCFKDVK